MRIFNNIFIALGKLIPIPKTAPPIRKQPNLATHFGRLLEMEKRRTQRLLREQQLNQHK